jgi:ATP-dependent DNA helicase RecQ
MMYALSDVVRQRRMIDSSEAPPEQKRVEVRRLDALLGYCEAAECRRAVLLRYLGEPVVHGYRCENCDVCLTEAQRWDATVAQKALAAVFRTGQRFGAGHLIDVLVGANTERTARFGHDQLKTFGVGVEVPRPAWQSVFRQLVAGGYLEVDHDGYGALRLTALGDDVLRARTTLELRRDDSLTDKPVRERKQRRGRGVVVETSVENQSLFDALRAVRREIAAAQGVPPYVVFHDKTLREMCEQMPRNLGALREISGVGDKKAERYGDAFLAAIRESL